MSPVGLEVAARRRATGGMPRRVRQVVGLVLLLLSWPVTSRSQTPADSADDRRRGELLRELRTLAAEEQRAMQPTRQRRSTRTMTATDESDVRERRRHIEALLDTLVLQRPGGARELGALQRAYPDSPLLRRTRADLDLRDGRALAALNGYDALLRRSPRDAAVARRRARALAALRDTARAVQAWSAVLDAEPEDREAFDSLLSWRSATGTLDALELQLERLRLFSVDSLLLANRQAEVAARRARAGGEP